MGGNAMARGPGGVPCCSPAEEAAAFTSPSQARSPGEDARAWLALSAALVCIGAAAEEAAEEDAAAALSLEGEPGEEAGADALAAAARSGKADRPSMVWKPKP